MKSRQLILISILITFSISQACTSIPYGGTTQRIPARLRRYNARPTQSLDAESVVRQFFPLHFEDTLRLEGSTVWMKDGYIIAYFPYKNGQCNSSAWA